MSRIWTIARVVVLMWIGALLPAQGAELLRLEAHWTAALGWENCGRPEEAILKVQGPAYVKQVSYEDPYTSLNFMAWEPLGMVRLQADGNPYPRGGNPGVVDIYSKAFQDGREVRNYRETLLRRERLWHLTASEVYYFKVTIASPCVRQSGGGQQRQDVLVIFKTQGGPDHSPEPDQAPFASSAGVANGSAKPGPAVAAGSASTWYVEFNGFPGAMEIIERGGRYTGRFNLHRQWEEMLDLRIEGGRISFRRAGADQRYEGTIAGKSMSGNFSQAGSGRYPWKATLVDGPGFSAGPTGVDQPGAKPSVAVASISTWAINFNSYPGSMEISQRDGLYVGRFNLGSQWEEMLDLRIAGGRISFRRAAADQRYEGTIAGKTISGNFSQAGTGRYPWKAELTGGPGF